MRARSVLLAAALAATGVLAPFAGQAQALSTTSTVVAYTILNTTTYNEVVYYAPADGSGSQTAITPSSADSMYPAVSPDGSRIAYVQADASFDYALWVRTIGAPSATLLAAGDWESPAWSADGTRLAFVRRDGTTGTPSVWTMPVDKSSAPVKAVDNADEPSFSPSGRQLAVSRWGAYGITPYGIDVVTIGTVNANWRTTGTDGGYMPTWSPDGQSIAFVKDGACRTSLWRVPAAGGTAVALRDVAGRLVDDPQWSRDGTQIFWNESPIASCSSVGAGDVYAMDYAGATPAAAVKTTAADEWGLSVGGGPTPPADTTAPANAVLAPFPGTVNSTYAFIQWSDDSPDATEFTLIAVPHDAPAPTSPDTGIHSQYAGFQGTLHGLAPDTSYDLYVWAYDASGNAAAGPSGAHPVHTYATPVITQIGLVSRTSTSTTFPVRWTATAPTYQLQVAEKTKTSSGWTTSAGFYHDVEASTPLTSRQFSGTQGHTYYFRVRGQDGFGNSTAYTTTTAYVPLNENASGVLWSSGWTSGSSSGRWLGTYRYTIAAGKAMSARFDTSSFTLIGDRCPSCGQVKVYVDGVLKATVNTQGSTTAVRQALWTSARFATIGSHQLKIVTVGTSGHPRVVIDGIGLTR